MDNRESPWRRRALETKAAVEQGQSRGGADRQLRLSALGVAVSSAAAALAAISAAFAGYSAFVNRDHEIASLRPYVYIEFADNKPLRHGIAGTLLTMNARNYGQTPALDVKAAVTFEVLPISTTVFDPRFPRLSENGGVPLAPGEPGLTTTAQITSVLYANSQRLRSGQAFGVAFISLSYRDIFNKLRSEKQCFLLGFDPALEVSEIDPCKTEK